MVPINDLDQQEDGTPQAFNMDEPQTVGYDDQFNLGSLIPAEDEYAPNPMQAPNFKQPKRSLQQPQSFRMIDD